MVNDSRGIAGADMCWRAWLVYKFDGGGEGDCEAFEMTPDDYLAILSVGLPLVTMAIAVAVIVIKQGWKVKKGG